MSAPVYCDICGNRNDDHGGTWDYCPPIPEDDDAATPVHDPGLDHLLEEVAAEVLRQDDKPYIGGTREQLITLAARCLRSVQIADSPTATLCTARHDVHEDGVTATWSCQQLGAHEEHRDSAGRGWKA